MSKKGESPGFYQSSNVRISRHPTRKTKKPSQEKDHKQLIEYIDKNQGEPLQSIFEQLKQVMPGHYQLQIWRKNMNLLTRLHLPLYVKLLEYVECNQPFFLPQRANINQKKNNKTDILIEDPITQKTRLIKMQSFPIIMSPHQLVFYKISAEEFEKLFQSTQCSVEELRKVYAYCLQQTDISYGQGEFLLWPAVLLQGLNYKFQEIKQFVLNFKISNSDSKKLIQTISRTINQSISNQNANESLKLQASELQKQQQQQQKQKNQPPNFSPQQMQAQQQQHQQQNENINVDHAQSQEQAQAQVEGTENNFCLWLVGTSQFIFRNTNIVRWHSLPQEGVKGIFNSVVFSGFIKQANLIIESLNKHAKLKQAQLKADQYKSFICRLGNYKCEEGQFLCIPLRFQFVKGAGKRILIKILKRDNTQLKWVPTQSTTVNYTLPIISRKQMNFLYLTKKLTPLQIVTLFFYQQFLYLPQKQISQVFYNYYPQFHVNQEEVKKLRCISCKFLMRQDPFKCCFFCKAICHQECALQQRKRQKISNSLTEELFKNSEQLPYICQKCQPCSVCLEAVQDDFLFCSTCFSYSHFECGRIKGLDQNQSKMEQLKTNDKYVCEFCLKCKMCSHKLKDSEYLLMDNQFYCSQCCSKIKANNHCHVCIKRKEGSTMKWIQCGDPQCEKWVHQTCDPQYIGLVRIPSASDPYLCPPCRIVQKRKIYVQIINSLSAFDEAQFFTQPTYKGIPFYDTLISQPMCFSVMKEKAIEGLYDQNAYFKLQSDFQLIVKNARRFNMPKDTAHVQAKILKILGQKALQKYRKLFNPQLKSLISGAPFTQLQNLKLQLHREINNHYPQILLNYKTQKSTLELRSEPQAAPKKKSQPIRPQDQTKFSSTLILNTLFRNSTFIFHIKKQKMGIANLFTMPKGENERGNWSTIRGNACYYHHWGEIVYWCGECCEGYCCMRECIRHRVCGCGARGCRCDSYECGCPPIKEKDRKAIQGKIFGKFMEPLKTYREILMEVTENFKYCLKCAQDRIANRICTACQNLCSWGYFRCPGCTKVWHKKCYPHLLSLNFAPFTQNQLQSQPQPQPQPQPSVSTSNRPLFSSFSQQQTVNQGYSSYSYNSNYVYGSNVNRQMGTQNTNSISANSQITPNPTCSILYCKQCFNQKYPNNYQQALTIESKSRIVKIAKITRYMRIFVQVYFNEGVRLTPYQIQQLILENFDQFSVREQLFKQYELNYSIIQRFRDFTFKRNAAIQRSCAEYLNDYLQMRKPNFMFEDISKGNYLYSQHLDTNEDKFLQAKWVYSHQFLNRCRKIWWKYFRFLDCSTMHGMSVLDWKPINSWTDAPQLEPQTGHRKLFIQKISQVRQNLINEAYTYKDYNSYHNEIMTRKSIITQSLQPYAKHLQSRRRAKNSQQNPQMQQQQQFQNFSSIRQYKSYIESLGYIKTMEQSFYKNDHHYRYTLIYHPRAMPFQYKLNPTFKKKGNLEQATKEFLLGIYEESKKCLRKGSTCILKDNKNKDSKDYWSVLKKWAKGKRQMHITLCKKSDGRWYLRIDNSFEKIVSQIQEIISQINRKNPQAKITSFKQLGQFLGFTILQPFYKANHFTNFLQTNLVDQMQLLDKMNKITQLYDSFSWGQNGIFKKSVPASLSSASSEISANQKLITYEYSMNRVRPQYLSKKQKKTLDKGPKRLQKRLSNANMGSQIQQSQIQPSSQVDENQQIYPFITFEDLKRYLIDFSNQNPVKTEISIKNNPILNQVFIAPSKIHKLGLFSRKMIEKHSIVIEYIGQIVSESVADLREKRFHYGCYLFGILKQPNKDTQDKKDIIDATFRGNMARYLNHSCDPNCKAKTQYINGSPRIIIYTIRDIQQFEQITYDYQFNVDAVEKLECTCGAKNCQGRLN